MIVTAQYQIYVGKKQKELHLSSVQLLMNIIPLSAAMVLFLVPVLDSVPSLLQFDYAPV